MRGLRPLLFSLFSAGYCLSRSSPIVASLMPEARFLHTA